VFSIQGQKITMTAQWGRVMHVILLKMTEGTISVSLDCSAESLSGTTVLFLQF